MRHTLVLPLLLLGACGGGPSRNDSVDWMMVAGAPSFDPAGLKEGEWALYRLILKDGEQQGQVKFKATKKDDSGTWIETTYIAMRVTLIVKSKLDSKGRVLELWMGMPGGEPPTKAELPPAAEAARPGPASKMKTDTALEGLVLNGRSYSCTRVINSFPHADGRTTSIKEWCCTDVPFAAMHKDRKIGGLVRRETEKFQMELLAHGVTPGEDLPLPESR